MVSKPWSNTGVDGAKKFLNRVWNFFTEPANIKEDSRKNLEKVYHQTVKKVTSDFEQLGFNTAISQMMIFVNACYKEGSCPIDFAEGLIKMLSCICPHIGEEIWSILGHDNTIAYEAWPVYDEEKTKDDLIEIAVQVNGKVRAKVMVTPDEDQEAVMEKVMASDAAKFINGFTIVKEI